jgi:hypothetical protein
MATEAEIDDVWKLATAAYPNFKAPAATLILWRNLLADIDGELLRAATFKCITDGEFFPTVHALRTAAAAIHMPNGYSGLESWGRVLKAAVRYGHDNPPGSRDWTFADPLTLDAVNAIGWAVICQSEDEMVMRAHYIKCYEQMRDRAAAAARELPAVAQVREQIAGRRAQQVAQLTAGIGRKP